jgi:hypothetical protein
LAPPDSWLLTALKKYLKRIHFACDEEVQAPMVKWFQEQPEEFYSDSLKKWLCWQHCIKRADCGKMRYRNNEHTLHCTHILCFVSIPCLGKGA